MPFSYRQRSRQFALWLALAAVLLRLLIPEGFMPERRAGSLSFSICYASPLAKLRTDQALPGGVHAHGDCVFSAAGCAPPWFGPVFGGEPHAAADAAALAPADPLSRFMRGRPPARAPPVYS